MAGETCPRCRNRNGYPIPSSIPRAEKMVFVCRDCGHRWVKRNASRGSFTQWFIYGIGFLIGIGIGLYQLFKILTKENVQIQDIIKIIKDFFAGLPTLIGEFFK